jgi:hypothetical protein
VKTNYVLIDYENVQPESLAPLNTEQFRVWVFLGPKNTRLETGLVLAMQRFQGRGAYVTMAGHGKNALDFHIAYYLGTLAKEDPEGFFHIISKDAGFDPLIAHMKTQKVLARRSESIEAMPCFSLNSKLRREQLLDTVVDDLVKRKDAKPATIKTLLSTIQARCGKDVTSATIEAIRSELEKRGFIKIAGSKITYSFPSERAESAVPKTQTLQAAK